MLNSNYSSIDNCTNFNFQNVLWLLQTGIEPAFVLFFDCPEEEMERRLLSRNQVGFVFLFNYLYFLVLVVTWDFFSIIKGREDDNIETIRKRFKVFLESSLPVINYYDAKGKVRKVIDSCVSTIFFTNIKVPLVLRTSQIFLLDWCCKTYRRGIWDSQRNFWSKEWEGKSLCSPYVKTLYVQVPFCIEDKNWESLSSLLISKVYDWITICCIL